MQKRTKDRTQTAQKIDKKKSPERYPYMSIVRKRRHILSLVLRTLRFKKKGTNPLTEIY
jgi:hypothetical protein